MQEAVMEMVFPRLILENLFSVLESHREPAGASIITNHDKSSTNSRCNSALDRPTSTRFYAGKDFLFIPFYGPFGIWIPWDVTFKTLLPLATMYIAL
ncbi:hypothetical protein BJY04DRAFT_75649 [Aspergillus karnatakaensis]|uniref:uncharacterized protein n=1 Tax=Aspergillus karnatakaensis TaxID=1810916 RepID=UPI003CCDA811